MQLERSHFGTGTSQPADRLAKLLPVVMMLAMVNLRVVVLVLAAVVLVLINVDSGGCFGRRLW